MRGINILSRNTNSKQQRSMILQSYFLVKKLAHTDIAKTIGTSMRLERLCAPNHIHVINIQNNVGKKIIIAFLI